jgi:hypothetical protein
MGALVQGKQGARNSLEIINFAFTANSISHSEAGTCGGKHFEESRRCLKKVIKSYQFSNFCFAKRQTENKMPQKHSTRFP